MSVANIALNIAGSPIDQLTNMIDVGVQGWLSTTLTVPVAHKGAITAGALASFYASMGLPFIRGYESGAMYTMNALMDKAARMLQQPNIEGITIHASSTSVNRDVEVASSPVIQQSISTRAFVTDSATPMPRTFSVQGYLTPMMPGIDAAHTIKPSIMAQAKYLDSCAMSRCPVWYKDDYNRFFLVIITNFKETHDPNVTNALQVSIDMQEYIPFIAKERMGSVLNGGMTSFFRGAESVT